jgi:hypothetical protein
MRYVLRLLGQIAVVVSLPALMIAAAVAGLVSKPVARTRGEVADLIERFLAGEDTTVEWDEFICVPIADAELERIRQRCADLEGAAEEEVELHLLLHHLRSAY